MILIEGTRNKHGRFCTWHVICELYEIQVHGSRYFLHTHSHSADSWEQSTVVDFMNRFPDTFQAVIDRSLFGPNLPHGTNTLTRWLTISGCVAQALSSSTHSCTVRQIITSAMSQQLKSDLSAVGTTDQPQHRLPLPTLEILVLDADETQPEEWEAEEDVMGGPLDPREVKAARHKGSTVFVGHGGVRVFHRSRGTGANRMQLRWPQVDRYHTKAAAKRHVTARVWCVRRCAAKGLNRFSRQHLHRKLYESYSELRFRKTFFKLKTLS